MEDRELDNIDRSFTKAKNLIENIIDVYRKIDEKQVHLERVNMLGLIRDVVGIFPDKNIEIKTDATISAMVDELKIKRCLLNLINNATAAIAGLRGDIWVSCFIESEKIVLEVGNTGSYIDPKRLESIFDEFFSTGKKQGRGLGLAIVKKFVEAHHGEVSCESIEGGESKGQVIFRIKIPSGTVDDDNYTYRITTITLT